MIFTLLEYIKGLFMEDKEYTDAEAAYGHMEAEDFIVGRLGFISDKYESGEGKTDVGYIANAEGDPGGKSYGVYQLSLNAGTLKRYVETTEFDSLRNFILGSEAFDAEWRYLASEHPHTFDSDQHDFIYNSLVKPALDYATKQGFITSSRAVQEALFSIAVQHGGYKRIIAAARNLGGRRDPEQAVKSLYAARTAYVKGLTSLSPNIKEAVLNRYVREEKDVLSLVI